MHFPGPGRLCCWLRLVEGHDFVGLEPHLINAEAVQFGYRGYRIGQHAAQVDVTWLIHKDSYLETGAWSKNKAKNDFADRIKTADLEDDERDAEVDSDEEDVVMEDDGDDYVIEVGG
jgi:hypothetical protein